MGTTGIDGNSSLTTASRVRIKLVKKVQKTTVTEKADRLLGTYFGAEDANADYAFAYAA